MGSTQHTDCKPQSGTSLRLVSRNGQAALMQRQRGMGMMSIFAIMAVAVFIGMFAFKVGPHYMENWTVSKIATDVASNPELLKQPRSKVYSYINQAYRTNNLWDLSPEETIKLKKDGNLGYVVTVQYEKRDTLFRNVDVVTSFDTKVSATH
ncbi:DUF4845 domain-containing protein [Granulosicoccus antarcticus]|uniref:DUF4845 domain-containing protein n=1 Tax=Granulosicoccus antarcticus IMCC3135 TaxID=1192854 RepID=A0A2Z2NVB8_9GAMM|nr:DUF4845 domain-containing protein [Granulosicoccus antarcticus]ASJ74455.1 hypothetical protein IMCC3135_21915 [Granulosicoccus antarcticus IMCC3135]